MKKTFYVIGILVLVLIAGVGIWLGVRAGSGKSINPFAKDFLWGVVTRPSGLGRYHISVWNKQLDTAEKLGVDYLRITWDAGAPDAVKFHKGVFEAVWGKGMEVFLVVEPVNFDKLTNPEQEGYDLASNISKNFKGKIKYYQLLNEVASTVLIGGQYSGENRSDYNSAKYQKAKKWITGASRAIRENDSSAKIVLTDQWTHYAFFDMLKEDGVDYDYLGWNWFSDMGFLGDKTVKDGTLLFDKLKSFDKPIILTEVNYRPNNITGQPEDKQADFIARMANWAWENNNDIKGFFVHELTDITNTPKKKVEYYGIVNAQKTETGAYIPGDPKKAYYIYQEIIKKH